jgi:hypothetical protein
VGEPRLAQKRTMETIFEVGVAADNNCDGRQWAWRGIRLASNIRECSPALLSFR